MPSSISIFCLYKKNKGFYKLFQICITLLDNLHLLTSVYHDLKKKGVLDEAIVSHVGRKIVFDAEKARVLASEYQSDQRQKK